MRFSRRSSELRFRVEAMGLEPTNLLTASQALYQLSYAPEGLVRLAAGGRALGQAAGPTGGFDRPSGHRSGRQQRVPRWYPSAVPADTSCRPVTTIRAGTGRAVGGRPGGSRAAGHRSAPVDE